MTKKLSRALAFTLSAVLSPLQGEVVINEIHYDAEPKTKRVEFIELYNAGAETVDLSGWRFGDGIDYTIPQGNALAPGGYCVIAENLFLLSLDSALENIEAEDGESYEVRFLGNFSGNLSADGERVALFDADGVLRDEVDYDFGFPWPTDSQGEGPSMELINPSLDNDLAGSWRAANTQFTPGERNSVYSENAPPQVRQVAHEPKQPVTGQDVVVSATVTDPDGVAEVVLKYQLVEPGNYISRSDSRYTFRWVDLPMKDDGENGDETAGDATYAATVPGPLQQHRHLMRYRIVVRDTTGAELRVPYEDDLSGNFAYFTYDGVPAWTGAVRPGVSDPVTYSRELLESVPVYHLITTRRAHEDSQHIPDSNQSGYTGSDYRWEGTLVYDGVVYDNIRFRARGGVWRYAMGKNMWKFAFNRGNRFQARDNEGNEYDTRWRRLNFSAIIMQGSNGHRGEQGLFESVGFKLFNLAGIEAPNTHYIHFRIIEDENESGADQYSGDFQGLYLAVEQPDGQFLEEHDLGDGNIYKMENGTGPAGLDGEKKHQGDPPQPSDYSDLRDFKNTYERGGTDEEWWRENLDLDRYYAYRSIVEGIHHYDIGYGKNYYYFNNPDTGKWQVIPWDLDLTWNNSMFGNGEEPFNSRVLGREVFNREYRNRLREIRDLLYNVEQTGAIIDHFASVVHTPGEPSLVDADRAMWDFNPILRSNYVDSGQAGNGRFYQAASNGEFSGMIQLMKDYVESRGNWIDQRLLDDDDIPGTPTVSYTGPTGYPANQLTFTVSPFEDPQGLSTFNAVQWRVAEYLTVTPQARELVEDGARWRYNDSGENLGTAWREPDYDDSSWASGDARLGYGNGGEATRIDYGDDSGDKHITYYFRSAFEVADPARFKNLLLELVRDDGGVVYLNGVEAMRSNMPDGLISASTRADSTVGGNDEARFHSAQIPASLLVAGANVIAVEIHQSVPASSDLSFDLRLSGLEAPELPEGVDADAFRLEWEADWVSEKLDTSGIDVSLPLLAIRESHPYRVRARYLDNTGRWSHWSAPFEFIAGAPDVGALSGNLIVSEFMYHSAALSAAEAAAGFDESDFEYIELYNRGETTLSLDGVRFTKGIDHDFSSEAAVEPGERALLVRNATAFGMRYGGGARIIGEYHSSGDRLSNGGERLKLSFGAGSPLFDFEYGDAAPWPELADGGGHSLVLLDPETVTDPTVSTAWASSPTLHGSPGAADDFGGGGIESWRRDMFTTSQLDNESISSDSADPDLDGLANLAEYALGTDPIAEGAPTYASMTKLPEEDVVRISYERRVGLVDVEVVLQQSEDLLQWTEVELPPTVDVQSVPGSDRETVTVELPMPASQNHFLRLMVSRL